MAWPKDQSDSNWSAGVDSSGGMVIGDDRGSIHKLAIKGSTQIYESTSEGARLHFGTVNDDSISSIGLDEDEFFSVRQGTNVPLYTTTSGIYATHVETPTIETTDINAADITSTSITTGSIDASGEMSLGSLAVDGPFSVTGDGADILLSGTASPEFRVGVGTLGFGNKGVKILTESISPSIPSNVRLFDLKPVQFNTGTHYSQVVLKTNWDTIHGTGSGNPEEFEVSSPVIDVPNDSLVGKYFVLQHATGTSTYEISG